MTLDLTKAFDSAVKAPLWIFFALAVGFGVVALNPFAFLGETDQGAVRATVGPPALWAVLFTSMFLSSLIARSGTVLWKRCAVLWERVSLRLTAGQLSPVCRATLALFEAEASDRLMLVANAPHIVLLRDRGLIRPRLIGQNEEWGQFLLRQDLERLRRAKPARYRSIMRTSAEEANGARQSMNAAFRRARRLVAG